MMILVAEDSQAYALLYQKIFESRGHTVVITNDGLECLTAYANEAKARKNEMTNPYDAVILDYEMPKKNGFETAREILNITPNQKILFITAFGDEILTKMDFKGPNVGLIQKPFNSIDLINKIEGLTQLDGGIKYQPSTKLFSDS
ncbi:response regulator [Candidatus Nitrosotenuis sp. DW1]|uniref:response regulator n=1 Tax=Candidatus Nitrosotenuis sp. DW1 TaxID=2259672 RepID=UPI0015CC7261|nr:response regulator [Candidatus Nitrosotenuis sp. DW1]QLH08994.1 response regulator [Candidatus Nitrosotenuis sp. DW1]